MTAALVTFTLAATVIILLPGPDTLVVVRNLIRGGRGAALWTVAGVLTGLTAWAVAAAFGLSAVLRASHDGYTALRLVGAAYLIWLGVQSLRARGNLPDLNAPQPVAPRRPLSTGYPAGLASNLFNPKVGVFFVTFLPGFVPHGHSIGVTSGVFGAMFVVETGLYFLLLIVLAGRITSWIGRPRVRRRMERVTGVVLIGFGARLAIER